METYEKLRLTSEPPSWDEYGVPAETRKTFALAMLNFTLDDAHGFWMPAASGDGHCVPGDFVSVIATRLHEINCCYNGQPTQSPIEDMLLGALVWLQVGYGLWPRIDHFDGPEEHRSYGPAEGLEYWITPQGKVAGCKVDFLVWFRFAKVVGGVAIECDGHAFHEKTKEQAASDKKRDRKILTAGFPVVRFTGSEIYRDAVDCTHQLREVLVSQVERVLREGGALS